MQLTVSELIKQLQKIEAKGGGGERLVAAREADHDDPNGILTGIVIIEQVTLDESGEVILGERS